MKIGGFPIRSGTARSPGLVSKVNCLTECVNLNISKCAKSMYITCILSFKTKIL